MKFLLISPKNRTVYNFRGDLLHDIAKSGYDLVVSGPDQTNVERIKALGAKFVEIPVNKTGTSIISDLIYCWRLYKLICQERPDATLGYTIKPVVYGAIAAKLAGVKNINCLITGGGYTMTAKTFKAKILGIVVKILYKIGLGCANSIIFQNNDDLAEFCSLKLVQKNKCHVVNGSGVNMTHFKAIPYPQEVAFFMLSRLLKSKGVMEYLEAAKLVKKDYPEVKFFLLGKYEENMQDAVPRETVEQFIAEGIIQRFEESSDVRPYYEKCSVYVLPSYREGTPRTVLEAMACARPVITTDTIGCRQTVINGQNGFLIPVGEVQSLAEKMMFFIQKPAYIEAMGQKSLEFCREHFEVSKINRNMLQYMNLSCSTR